MAWTLYLFALFAGAASTALGGSNATLAKILQQPLTAGLIVQVVTVFALIVVGVFYGGMRWPDAGRFAALPWWAWLGGFGAATILLAQLLVARKIGASSYFALTVTAGVLMSVALDQFGWMGFDRNPAHASRLIGAALMVAGVVLVTRN